MYSEFTRLQADISKSYEDLMHARNDLYSHSASLTTSHTNGPDVMSVTVQETDILLTNFKQSLTHFAHTVNSNHDFTNHSTMNFSDSTKSSRHTSPHKS